MPSQSLLGNVLAAKARQVLLPSELRLSTCKTICGCKTCILAAKAASCTGCIDLGFPLQAAKSDMLQHGWGGVFLGGNYVSGGHHARR